MAKIIKYQYLMAEINNGTEENPDIVRIFQDAEIVCPTQAVFDANYPIAEKEAVGEIDVDGEFDPEPVVPPAPEEESSVWDELDAAYQEGVDSV